MQSLALILIAALAGQTYAQAQCASIASQIPACAQSCIASADSAVGCALTDYACGCSKSAQVQQSAAGCILNACPFSSIAPLQSTAAALCSCVATASAAAPTTTLVTTTSSSSAAATTSTGSAAATTSSGAATSSAAATTAAATTAAATTAAASSTDTCNE